MTDIKELNDEELNMVAGGTEISIGDGIHANTIYRNRQNTNLYAWVVSLYEGYRVVYYDVTMESSTTFKKQSSNSKFMNKSDFTNQYYTNIQITGFRIKSW